MLSFQDVNESVIRPLAGLAHLTSLSGEAHGVGSGLLVTRQVIPSHGC